jgi:hypothetical protein
MDERDGGRVYDFEKFRRKKQAETLPSSDSAIEMEDPAINEADINTYFISTGENGRHSIVWVEKAGYVKYIPNLSLEQSLMYGDKLSKMGYRKSTKF